MNCLTAHTFNVFLISQKAFFVAGWDMDKLCFSIALSSGVSSFLSIALDTLQYIVINTNKKQSWYFIMISVPVRKSLILPCRVTKEQHRPSLTLKENWAGSLSHAFLRFHWIMTSSPPINFLLIQEPPKTSTLGNYSMRFLYSWHFSRPQGASPRRYIFTMEDPGTIISIPSEHPNIEINANWPSSLHIATVHEISTVIGLLVQSPPALQKQTIERFFTPDAEFTHPFCRTWSWFGSRLLIIKVYQAYKIMSPRIEYEVKSVGESGLHSKHFSCKIVNVWLVVIWCWSNGVGSFR